MFIVKVPGVNGVSDTSGCRNVSNSIIRELRKIQRSEEGKITDMSLVDLEEIHVDNSNLEEADELIFNNSLETFQTRPKTIFLGGDHSITYSTSLAFLGHCRKTGKEPCLIVFDSMPNCRKDSKNEFPDNENWLRKIVNNGFNGNNILLVGTRSYSSDELDFLKNNRIKVVSMNQFVEDIQDTCDFVMEFSNGKETYVSIDASVVDSAFIPSSTHHEPGGFTGREIIYLIQRLSKIKNLRAVDLVEINTGSSEKKEDMSLKMGAKIISEIL